MKVWIILILISNSFGYLENFKIELVSNLRECLNRKVLNPSISCDIHLKLFLDSSSAALIEVFQMIDTEKRASFPLVIYPGVQSGMLKQLGSSSYGSNTGANRARLDTKIREGLGSWVPDRNVEEEYLQFSASQPVQFHSIQTKGDLNEQRWVKTYRIQYSLDGNTWIMYKNGLIFLGNTNNNQGVNNTFNPFVARAVRIIPQSWANSIAIRAEMYISDIYYEAEPPSERLVLIQAMKTGFNVIASSVYDAYHSPDKIFLGFRTNSGYSAWCAGVRDDKQWFIISSPAPVRWHRLSFQGRGFDYYRSKINSVYIMYTVNGLDWVGYEGLTEFIACYDDFTINSIELVPFIALALKVIPKIFLENICVRGEAFCSRI